MDGDEFTPWTPEGAAHLRSVAADLTDGVLEHAKALARFAGAGPEAEDEWDAANDSLRALLKSYGDVLFDYTGSSDPVSNVYRRADNLEDETEAGSRESPTISILQRDDYSVVDERTLIEAGVEAEISIAPDDALSRERIVSAVPDGIQAIAHASPYGWAALRYSPGIRLTSSVVLVKGAPTAMNGELYDLPSDSSFDLSGSPTLFSQLDQY